MAAIFICLNVLMQERGNSIANALEHYEMVI